MLVFEQLSSKLRSNGEKSGKIDVKVKKQYAADAKMVYNVTVTKNEPSA